MTIVYIDRYRGDFGCEISFLSNPEVGPYLRCNETVWMVPGTFDYEGNSTL